MMEWTILDLLYFSSHAATSSGETRRLERSMYPFSLSTRSTITGSTRPTLMSLDTERMRRRVSSERRIIPSMLLYSSSWTYAPISAMDLTWTMTTSSTSGNFASYMRHSLLDVSCGSAGAGRKGERVRSRAIWPMAFSPTPSQDSGFARARAGRRRGTAARSTRRSARSREKRRADARARVFDGRDGDSGGHAPCWPMCFLRFLCSFQAAVQVDGPFATAQTPTARARVFGQRVCLALTLDPGYA